MDDTPSTDHPVVVLGPRTALAEHLLARQWAANNRIVLVAQDRQEARFLSSRYRRAEVLTGSEAKLQERWPQTVRAATVIVCAFGLIHPAVPDWSSHARILSRDLETIAAILENCRSCPVTVIFVSTALAAAPNNGRAYYVGWKYLSEALLAEILAKHNSVRFCVLLPGRLVGKKTLTRPLSLLHTSYSALARVIFTTARAPKTQRRVVGLDARILMMVRGVRLLINGVLGCSA
jgi:hypothetical protein